MKSTLLASAVAAALALASVDASAQAKGAATKAEVQAMQAQLDAVLERLNKLEAANTALQTENTQLKEVVESRDAEMDYLKAEAKGLREESAVASNELAKVKGADWAGKIKGRGDFRYRHEMIETQRVSGTGATATVEDSATRQRERIRARLGFDAKITDQLKGTLQIATGGDDPRSSNQTLGSQGTRKSIGLDLGFVDWNFINGGNLVLGKQTWPFWRPSSSLFYDGDYNPEGGSIKFERGMLFGSAYGWWLSEQYNSNAAGENNDGNVFGAQVGLKFPLFDGETRVAAHYYDCGACQNESSILFANNGNGNTTYSRTVGTATINYLRDDFEVIELAAEMGMTLFNQPFSLWANYAVNTAAEKGSTGPGVTDRWVDDKLDTAYSVGVSLGRASNPKTWQAAVWYASLDANSLFGQFVDSDFGDGRTDSEGWVLRGAYAPVRNFNIQATYFINTINKDVATVRGGTGTAASPLFEVGDDLDYNRLQLDLNYKF